MVHYPKVSASAGSALRYPEGSTQPLLSLMVSFLSGTDSVFSIRCEQFFVITDRWLQAICPPIRIADDNSGEKP